MYPGLPGYVNADFSRNLGFKELYIFYSPLVTLITLVGEGKRIWSLCVHMSAFQRKESVNSMTHLIPAP